MDITLERILSLLPHDQNGKIVRGAKKDFAMNIGYDSGDIVSAWIYGKSTSYRGKLHEIAAKYNVSVEWLKGETDRKRTVEPHEVTAEDLHILQQIHDRPGMRIMFDLNAKASDADIEKAVEIIRAYYGIREDQP